MPAPWLIKSLKSKVLLTSLGCHQNVLILQVCLYLHLYYQGALSMVISSSSADIAVDDIVDFYWKQVVYVFSAYLPSHNGIEGDVKADKLAKVTAADSNEWRVGESIQIYRPITYYQPNLIHPTRSLARKTSPVHFPRRQ